MNHADTEHTEKTKKLNAKSAKRKRKIAKECSFSICGWCCVEYHQLLFTVLSAAAWLKI